MHPNDPAPSLRRRPRQSLLRNERGGMYAEAVIMLPVFILVWSLINFVNQGYRRALTVGTQTRGAGWANVMGQCQDDVASPVARETASTMYSGLLTTLSAAVRGGASVVRYQPLIVSPINLFGDGMTRMRAVSFTFDAYRYQQTESVPRPRAIGGSAEVGHHIDLVCDEIHDEVNLTLWITTAYGTMR
ncbi:MAG: hypothetical protein KF901_30085 [Myxococcales bacterium]|nr:hypothetical protein [Myxococcales bacterium]